MPERPIPFTAPMIRALLDGRKTQTRPVLKPQPFPVGGPFYRPFPNTDARQWYSVSAAGMVINIQTVPYAPGDRLWVKEGHALVPASAYRASEGVPQTVDPSDAEMAAIYREGFDRSSGGIRWRSPRFMPRWASRITLTVTDVRVQRLQDISEKDAIREGCIPSMTSEGVSPTGMPFSQWSWRDGYRDLWNSLHGPDAWDANPWVCALTFTVREGNIDDA